MKFGCIATSGGTGETLDLAVEAEAAGWDGFFTWDGISVGDRPTFDPWALLGGIAVKTTRMTLGAMIFPLSRRRPWKVAREAITVDHLSNGRLVIPVGLGAVDDGGFARVKPGETTDRKTRAALLDETLEIVERAWTGEPFSYQGAHYRVDDLVFQPTPVQQPRIPIWVVGAWPSQRSMGRAARWDGVVPSILNDGMRQPTPNEIREIRSWIGERRGDAGTFEIVLEGVSPGDDPTKAAEEIGPLAEAGATWWIESRWEAPNDVETLRTRIRQGPPRL